MSDAVLLAKGNGESLLSHSLNVIQHVIMLSEDLSPADKELLRLAAGFHDLGKAWADFQNKLIYKTKTAPLYYRHELASLAFLGGIEDESIFRWVSYLVAHHHKSHHEINIKIDNYNELEILVSNLPDITPLMRVLGLPPARPLLKVMKQSLSSLRATQKDKEVNRQKMNLKGALGLADWRASSGLLPARRKTIPAPVIPYKLYNYQKAMQGVKGHVQIIGPTGSGKTEMACILVGEQKVKHCFYSTPTNASLNALEPRLNMFFPEMVGLQHGNSRDQYYLKNLDKQLAEMRINEARLGVKAVLLTTIYQIIRPFYRPTDYEIIAFLWNNAAFIFDEIHAYEPKQLGFLISALEWINANYKCVFIFMSATFPNLIANKLDLFIPDRFRFEADRDTYKSIKRHVLRLRDGDLLDYLDEAIAEAQQGKSVVLRFNWILRAVNAYKYIKARHNGMVKLLHSEYTPSDRQNIENALNNGGILVTTQVIEVSLNLDFDRGYSDIAPIDALIQFFGRVNRFGNLAPVEVTVFNGGEADWKIYNENLIRYTKDALRNLNGQTLDEYELRSIVNDVYDRYALDWEEDYKKGIVEFNRLKDEFVAGEANKECYRKFYELFTGYKMLPASFKSEYENLLNDGEKEKARTLFVPVSGWRYERLKGRKLKGKSIVTLWKYDKKQQKLVEASSPDSADVEIVDTGYNSEYGLRLGEAMGWVL